MDIQGPINEFITKIANAEIEIYNEASIQYELAIFLRDKLGGCKIQLERNVVYFELDKNNFEKKEIDLVVSNDNNEKTAVEIKFPTNGQVPEQMFSFCKDIKFLEQLKEAGFQDNFFLAFTNDSAFWNNNGEEGTIYYKFRKQKLLSGTITKPTGSKDKTIDLAGKYAIMWKPVTQSINCFVIKI